MCDGSRRQRILSKENGRSLDSSEENNRLASTSGVSIQGHRSGVAGSLDHASESVYLPGSDLERSTRAVKPGGYHQVMGELTAQLLRVHITVENMI